MTDNNLGKEILDKIKERNIKPKSRWEFLLKDYTMWALFILSIIIGSLAVAIMIFLASHGEFAQYLTDDGFIETLLLNVPYFWLVFLAIFVVIAFYNFEHTRKGYKYNIYLILVVSVSASLILGVVVNAGGGGEKLEQVFYSQSSLYRRIMHQNARMLTKPEYNQVAGFIQNIHDDHFELHDFRDKMWQVYVVEDTMYPEKPMYEHMRVIITGQKLEDGKFEARYIQPMYGKMKEVKGAKIQPKPVMK